VDNTLDFHALLANISPRAWCQKMSPLFVAFVSETLNLDPKTYHMSVHQREEAQNGGCSPESVLNYLEIWLRRPPSIYVAFLADSVLKNPIIQFFE
jgi:hypothetical protein